MKKIISNILIIVSLIIFASLIIIPIYADKLSDFLKYTGFIILGYISIILFTIGVLYRNKK